VGFIRKLPHTLVAAFRSTLESALHDDVLIHLIDASHPMALEHAETTRMLLHELDANEESILTVLNKSDLCKEQSVLNQLKLKYPKTVVISATEREGFDALMQLMMKELSEKRVKVKLQIPQSRYDLVASLRERAHVLYEEYEGNDVIILAEMAKIDLYLFDSYIIN